MPILSRVESPEHDVATTPSAASSAVVTLGEPESVTIADAFVDAMGNN